MSQVNLTQDYRSRPTDAASCQKRHCVHAVS